MAFRPASSFDRWIPNRLATSSRSAVRPVAVLCDCRVAAVGDEGFWVLASATPAPVPTPTRTSAETARAMLLRDLICIRPPSGELLLERTEGCNHLQFGNA